MLRVRSLARHGPAADFAKGKQPPSYAVVSETELQNLKDFLSHDPTAGVRAQQEDRLALKNASTERAKHWPNLIETLRLKKERDRLTRLEEEEDARKELDAKERAFQADIRDDSIKKANLMLYEQDDRVKTFTSKLMLSKTLDERAQQVLLARQKKEKEKQSECTWAIMQQEVVTRAKAEEEQKIKKRRNAAEQLKSDQRDQLAQVRTRKIRERDDARQEGVLIRQAAEAALLREKEQDEERRQKAADINKQYLQHNQLQRVLKQETLKKEQQELEKIQMFARVKEEQMKERKRRAEERFQAQLTSRQKLIDEQAVHLEALAGEAEERVLTQIRDAELEREKKEKQDREQKQAFWLSVDASRQRQMARKDAEKTTESDRKRFIQASLAKQQASLLDEELEERQQARRKADRLRAFQLLQVKEKEEKRLVDRNREIEEGLLMAASAQKDDDMFQAYVASVMKPLTQPRSPHPPSPTV
ncbi:hypothetical protein DIPPA_27686 [Diplonema papillatum]|nr:hypothetical protein DIPPA_27686 [Diplonema papillatum]